MSESEEQRSLRILEELLTKETKEYAWIRVYKHSQGRKKKVSMHVLEAEIQAGRILGEMNASEKLITTIRANPDFTLDDLVSVIQNYVVVCNNSVVNILNETKAIELDDVLECHGYFEKEEENTK